MGLRHFSVLTLILLMPATASFAQASPTFAPDQLEQLLAPIALYPDPLLSEGLEASAYPQQVEQADYWVNDRTHAGWSDDQAFDALQQQPWDPSVKALTAFPQVLHTLSNNAGWTDSVGAAYITQPDDVMNAVQELRLDAQESGHLYSTPQFQVYQQGSNILIEPANPNALYVPVYNPAAVYGVWSAPQYPPFAFPQNTYSYAPLYAPLPYVLLRPFWKEHKWEWSRRENNEPRFEHHDERTIQRPHSEPVPVAPSVRLNGEPHLARPVEPAIRAPAPVVDRNQFHPQEIVPPLPQRLPSVAPVVPQFEHRQEMQKQEPAPTQGVARPSEAPRMVPGQQPQQPNQQPQAAPDNNHERHEHHENRHDENQHDQDNH